MRTLVLAACMLLSAPCRAGDFPIVGLLEQFPVAPNGGKDIARPVFILTNRKLTAPTVFASASMTLSTRYDAKSDRMMYSFRQGQKTITFSEPAMPH